MLSARPLAGNAVAVGTNQGDGTMACSSAAGRLTVFAFLWSCQALVHQGFFPHWIAKHQLSGWILTALAVAGMVRPSSTLLLAGLACSSVVYRLVNWPIVINHLLVEWLINIVILLAIVRSLVPRASSITRSDRGPRDEIYDRFAPVVATMLVLVYYFAFLAKLNWGFVDAGTSCVVVMYRDLLDRFSWLPGAARAGPAAMIATLLIEGAIPLLLTFRTTRYAAILIGVPFHIVLGLVGHRTFAAIAVALYSIFTMRELTQLAQQGRDWLSAHLDLCLLTRLRVAISVCFAALVALLCIATLTGHDRVGFGLLKVYRIEWALWLAWSVAMGLVYVLAFRMSLRNRIPPAALPAAQPGFLRLGIPLVLLNGLSPYLGLKTETSFTMYSNLRTEGRVNNHFFMPAWRLASYQDDLVRILSTDIPELERYTSRESLITYFELRRVLSAVEGDFEITFERGGQTHELHRRGGSATDSDLLRPDRSFWAKLLQFRPVPSADRSPCQH